MQLANSLSKLSKGSKISINGALTLDKLIKKPNIHKTFENHIKTISQKYKKLELVAKKINNPPFIDTSFCDPDIKKWIVTGIENKTIETLQLKTTSPRPGFILNCCISNKDKVFINKSLNRKADRLHVLSEMLYPNQMIKIDLWFALHRKVFPLKSKEKLTSTHLNSGATYGKHIWLWREEESDKVLVHEVIHQARMHSEKYDQVSKMHQRFRVTKDSMLRPFEAFTEWLAICFHIGFVMCELNLAKTNMTQLYQNEYLFGVMQTAKILNNFGFKSW